MSKLKSPLLGLGASGTIADALTFQRAHKTDIVRSKPIPAYRYTLPQAYQRWLYSDYVAYWNDQSLAVKRQWQSDAVPYHMTGFAYWMKLKLRDLPDIAAWWRMDDNLGATSIDSSRNANPLTLVGVSPATGGIGGGLSFDGINDRCIIGNPTILTNFTEMTIEFLFNISGFTGLGRCPYDAAYAGATFGFVIYTHGGQNQLIFDLKNTAAAFITIRPPFTPDIWNHGGITWDGTTVKAFMNGTQPVSSKALSGTLACSSTAQELGRWLGANWWNGLLDNLIVYRRCLTPADMLRHSGRRYPV